MEGFEELLCFIALVIITLTAIYMVYICPIACCLHLAAWCQILYTYYKGNWRRDL